MSKPEDIPQDVWGEAVETTVGTMAFGSPRLTDTIARAIMAAEKRGEEREREVCAVLTDGHAKAWGRAMGTEIAFAIRARQ